MRHHDGVLEDDAPATFQGRPRELALNPELDPPLGQPREPRRDVLAVLHPYRVDPLSFLADA